MKAFFAIVWGIERFVDYNLEMTERGATLEYEIRWEKFNREEEMYEYVVLATNVSNNSNVDMMDAYTKHYDIESVYKTLKIEIADGRRRWKQRTPAMAANLTDHVWTLEELFRFKPPP